MLLCQRAFIVLCASYLLTHSWAIAQENEQSEKLCQRLRMHYSRLRMRFSVLNPQYRRQKPRLHLYSLNCQTLQPLKRPPLILLNWLVIGKKSLIRRCRNMNLENRWKTA